MFAVNLVCMFWYYLNFFISLLQIIKKH